MTTYRLPDALGGGEVEIVTPAWADKAIVCEVALVSDPSVRVTLARRLLVEVTPPLPPEPLTGYYLLKENSAAPLFVAEHEQDYGQWYVAGHEKAFSWSELCAHWPSLSFTRLVPDPFAEPVELPWVGVAQKFSSIGPAEVSVELCEQPGLRFLVRVAARPFGDGEWRLSWPRAREMARALWAAADTAEAAHDLALATAADAVEAKR